MNLLKMQLENLQSIQAHGDESSKSGKASQALKILQDQLHGLEEEKKRLNETIRRFDNDTEELTDMFAVQREKFELEVANKDRVISVLEKERELIEKDSKYNKNELEKTRSTKESIKKQVEQLKSSIQEKDAAIVNLSDLHNAVLKQTHGLQKELILSEESLKNELSSRAIIEGRLADERKENALLTEEVQQLKIQLKSREQNDIEFRAAKIQMLTEVERLKELAENLEMEKKEKEKDINEVITFSEKLRREKENTENVLEEMERKAAELKLDFDKLRSENFQMEKKKKSLENIVENLQTEMKCLSETRTKKEKEMSNLQKSLEKTEKSLESRMIENNTLEDNVETLNKTLDELKKNKEQQKKYIQTTRDELDAVISDKQSLELDCKRLNDNNRLLKEKVDTFSKEIESLQVACDTKTKQNEDLEDVMKQKNGIIASLQEQEQKLENDIEEFLGNEASSGIELKNVKNECTKLQQENKTIGNVYEKVNLQLQECLDLLEDKREQYTTEKKRLEEELEKLAEETSRFRKLNGELSKDLSDQSDEIISLTMDKEKFLQMFDDHKINLEAAATVQNRLEEEVHLLKQRFEKSKKDERLAMEKHDEVKRKYEDTKRTLEMKEKEKNDVEDSLVIALDDAYRWKKVSREMKEERDRLQIQIEELDRDLNEKHLHFTEEKSSLEKDMESLGNVVRRLKSNEERLRTKVEDLRDEVDKLSDIKSEQLTQIRTLVHEKNQMADTIADHENIVKEHTLQQKNIEEARRENADLRTEVDTLQEKARKTEEENERLRKELQEHSSLLNGTQAQVKETNQQYKELRNECVVLSECNAEIQEAKQRLFNENSRLKEKKSNMIQERNRLQDMIESLDKCHSEKYENLTRKNALLEKELTSLRHTIKNYEEKERRLLNDKKESNEKLQKVMRETVGFQGAFNKSDVENKRLKKRIGELVKEIEQTELECEAKTCMEMNLQENEECIKKLKQNAKAMNTLIISLNQQQNQRKDELNDREREIDELKANIERKNEDNRKFKEVIGCLNKELEAAKTREHRYVEELQDEKDNNGQSASLILRMEKERDDCKELYERNCDKHKKKVQDMGEEISKILEIMQKLENDNVQINLCNDGLNSQIQSRQDDICLLTAEKSELEKKSKKIDEEKVEFTNEINNLLKENQSLRKHAENLEKIIASADSAMSDQTSGMEKEIQVLRESLAQHRSLEESNRRENEELKEKLQKEKNENVVDEIKINEMRLKQERLEGKNEELLSKCTRFEEVVNKGVELKLEKESMEQLLVVVKKKAEDLENELEEKIQQVAEQNFKHENLQCEISKYNESIKKLKNAKEELLASNKKLTQRNEHVLQECNLTNENYKQMSSEKLRLSELVTFQEKEIESLKKEVYNTKSELQAMSQEAKSDKSQLQDDLKKTEETLARITEKQQRLQDELRKVKEETEDLENENVDLLTELDQSKEEFTRVKDTLCAIQIDHGNLQEELRANLNNLSEKTEKHNLEKFEMETEITSLKQRLTHAHERIEKQREMEKILREEIEELSDAYVKLEEEIHHGNKENLVLKEKLQDVSQNVEELELARVTASLLKEKRHSELLKSEKNVQRLEKNLREKQNSNKKLWKELNAITEKQKFHELKLDSEKYVSEQRLKELQDLQNSQRGLEEQLWLSKTNQEKLEAEIQTWTLNSNSMKIRVEMLEEELKYTTDEKEKMAILYTETKNKKCLSEEEAQKKEIKLCQQKDFLEERVRETSEEKDRLKKNSKCLAEKLDQKESKITDLNTLLEDVNNKYECLRMLDAVLHNDMTRKDEQIETLEKRKKQMINSLADLDSKIAEIQVQAISLEDENNNLREELAEAVSKKKYWEETVEQQAKLFSEKLERETTEKQQLHDTKECLQQAHINTEIQLQETNVEMTQLRTEKERVVAENASLLESKNSLVDDVKEKELTVNKLTQILNVQRDKTDKLKEEISCLLVECQTLKTENSHIIEQQANTNCDLKETKAKIKDTEDRLEDKTVNLEKMEENLSITQKQLKEQERIVANLSVKHNEILEKKDKQIDSVTGQNQHLEKIVDTLTSNLHQCKADNARSEIEKKCIQEIVTRKEQLLVDLQTTHQNVVKMKESLESEKKCLSSKLRLISKDLAKLEFNHERSLLENEKLYSENVNQKQESTERRDMLLKEKQMLEEEFQVQKTKLANIDIQNNSLRQRNNIESIKLQETVNSLKDIQQTLHKKHEEIERLWRTLQKSNLERDNLHDVNQKMSNALFNLKYETGFGPKQNNLDTRESLQEIHKTSNEVSTDVLKDETVEFQFSKSDEEALPGNSSTQFQKVDPSLGVLPRENSELETSVSLVESEVRSLRNDITERETEISRLNVLLDLSQNEKESLDVELARHVKRCEHECKQKENINEDFRKTKHDFKIFTKEKEETIRILQEKNLNIAKRSATMEEEIDFLKTTKLNMENQREEIEQKIGNLQDESVAKEKELRCTREKIVSCKEEMVCFEKKISDLGDRNEKMKELIAKYEEEREEHLNQIEKCQELLMVNLNELEKLENGFQNLKEYKTDGFTSFNMQDTLREDDKESSLHQERSELTSLVNRFNKLHEKNAFQFKKMVNLQEELTNGQNQWEASVKKLNECKTAKGVLEKEYLDLDRKFTSTETKYKEVQGRVNELETKLETTEERLAVSSTIHEEEKRKISQELTQMQIELVSACEKFNKSISKAKILEEKLQGKDKHIIDLENSLRRARENEGKFEIRNAEWKTKTEILGHANGELNTAKEKLEKGNKALENILRNEREESNKQRVLQQVTIGQLTLKLEDAEWRVMKMTEQLAKAEDNFNQIQDELNTSTCQFRENDLRMKSEIKESYNTILQLNQSISQLKEEVRQLEKNKDDFITTNKSLKEKISSIEKGLQKCKNVLNEASQEKDILQKSLEEMFIVVFNENEENCHDANDQISKVAKVVEQLRKREEMLKNDCEHLKKQLSIIQDDKKMLHYSFKAKDEDVKQLIENNTKLKKYVQKLEVELDKAEARSSHIEHQLHGLKDDLEAMKSNEIQQQYQYKVLENEKENLENEALTTHDTVETLFEKIRDSFHLFSPEAKSRIHDDSGVYADEDTLNETSERGTSDSGIFSPGCKKSMKFPENEKEETFLLEHNRSFQESVEKSFQIMTFLDKTFHEKTHLFSEKEEKLANEIGVLKQTVNHNNDIRSVLENDVQRLDQTQKTLQEQLKKKHDDLTSSHVELRHLEKVLREKEKVVEMLNVSIQEYQKRQEFLENKLEVIQKEAEQKNNQRLDLEKGNMEYEKKCEELRQNMVRNDVISQRKTIDLDTKIRELENKVTEAENMNVQLRSVNATLNTEQKESAMKITGLESHLKEVEEETKEFDAKIAQISRELENSITTNGQLEKTYTEIKEAFNEAIKRQQFVNIERENDANEIKQAKEEINRLLLESNSLADERRVLKQSLKEKECENMMLVTDVAKKEKLVKDKETKLKAIADFLEQINKCKDQLENEIDQAKKSNEELKISNELLKKEKKSMLDVVKTNELEIEAKVEAINQLQKMNVELEKDSRSNRHAVKKASDMLEKSLSQSEKIKNIADATEHLLKYPACTNHKKRLDNTLNISKSRGSDDEEKVEDSRNVPQQLSKIYITIETVFQECKKNVEDQRDLLNQVFQLNQLLKKTEQENDKLHNQEKQLHHKVITLSEECSNLESLSEMRQQDLVDAGDKLFLEKRAAKEHENLNSALTEQVNQLQVAVISYAKLADDLRKDRSAFKIEIMETQTELYSLKSTCERLDHFKEELNKTKFEMGELKADYDKCMMEKQDAILEIEYAQKKVRELESANNEEKRVIDETQKALILERERIITVTKLARLKESDLGNAKMFLKEKEDFIGQLQRQATEINEEKNDVIKEFSELTKELMTVQENNEILTNKNVFLGKKCSTLEQQREESQREKHTLEEENTKQKTKISFLAKSYEQQKENNVKLTEEVKLQREECNVSFNEIQRLKSEKTKIMKAMESMEEKLQARYQELLEKCATSHCKIRDLENSYNQARNQFIQTESRKDQLEKILYERDEKLTEVQNQRVTLQVEVKTQEEGIEDLKNEVAYLINQTNVLKKSEEILRIENSQLKSAIKETKGNLEEAKNKLAHKERDEIIAREKISSGKEFITILREEAAKSEKQLEGFRDSVVEKERILENVNQDLEFQRNTTTQLRDDKSNVDELYRLCQRSEKVLRKDLEDCKLAIDKIKSENNVLRKANSDLQEEIANQKSVIKDSRISLHTVRQEKIEINSSLTETQAALHNANDDTIACRKTIDDIRKKVALMRMELTLANKRVADTDAKVPRSISLLPSSSAEILAENEMSDTGAEFKDTNASNQIPNSLLEDLRKIKRDFEVQISENQTLNEEKRRHECTIKHLEASLDELKITCRKLGDKETKHEKSFCELQGERNFLDSKVNELEKSIFHQQEKNKEISKEISRLTQEKYSLGEKMRAVEASLGDALKENAVLILKQEQMAALQKETLSLRSKSTDLEELYKTVRKETTDLEKQTSAYEKKVDILQKELDASLEINEHLETQYADESKNNNALRLKVEEQSHRVVTLDNLLKTTVSQVEEKNSKIASLKEDAVYSKKEMETKLHEITMILKGSENLLSQEKNENANLRLEIKANEKKLKEKTDNLLSSAKIREDTVKQELESTKTLLDDIKTELNTQRKKTTLTEEKRNSTVEELSTLKVNYIYSKGQLEQRQKEKNKLQDENNNLKAQVNEMDEKMQSTFQESLKKAGLQKQEIQSLRTELLASEIANQSLGKDMKEIRGKSDILRKQKYQNQQEFNSALEEKQKILKELELSCSKRENIIEEVTKELITEKHTSEKLEQNLFLETANLREAKSNLETLQQKHKDIAQELIHLHQTVVENWKLNDVLESSDKNLEEKNKRHHDRLEPSKTIRSLCISLKSLKSYTDELEWNSSNLREQLAKSDGNNREAVIAQIQLKEEVKFLRVEVKNLQNDSKSLKESLEESHRSLQKETVENKTMRAEVIELKEKKTEMEETIEQLQDAYLALNTEMGIVERKRVSLEDTLRGLESERNKTVKELSTATGKIIALQENSNELSKRNSCLLGELTTLGTQAEATETSLSTIVNENTHLQERLAEAQKENSDLEKTKQDLLDEKAAAERKLKNVERDKVIVEVELRDVKRMHEKLTDELNKLKIFNTQTMEENEELKQKKTQLEEEKEKLERNTELFHQRVDRLENDQSDKDMAKTRLQNQLDEAFNSLERQQSKLSQALSDKENLRNDLLKSEKELKVVVEDNADLNQQLYTNTHRNVFSSPNSDELSRFRNQLSELRSKELSLTQENRFILEKLREKSDELRESKLRQEQSRREMGKSRNKTKWYLDEGDRWDGEVKSVISQIRSDNKPSSDSENTKNFFSEKVNNARRKNF